MLRDAKRNEKAGSKLKKNYPIKRLRLIQLDCDDCVFILISTVKVEAQVIAQRRHIAALHGWQRGSNLPVLQLVESRAGVSEQKWCENSNEAFVDRRRRAGPGLFCKGIIGFLQRLKEHCQNLKARLSRASS